MNISAIILATTVAAASLTTEAHFVEIDDTALFEEEKIKVDFSFLENADIAILGDSITACSNFGLQSDIEPIYNNAEEMWWWDLHPKTTSAVGGSYIAYDESGEYMTFDTGTRLAPVAGVENVIVYGGTCDLLAGVSIDEFKRDYTSLVNDIRYRGTNTIILCTLPPLKNDNWAAYNDAIKEVAESEGCLICDFSDAWTLETLDVYTQDGVHPNTEGMKTLGAYFK